MAAVLPLDPGATAPRPARTGTRAFQFGKYREIIIAVAFFLLFDLGVLVLNFYTSFKIDQDTVAINLAGRQRYVSQRIARTLLELDAARAAGRPMKAETLAELRAGAKIFDLSHEAFKHGATIPGGDGKPVFLDAVTSEQGRALEARVDTLWKPYFQKLQPLLADGFGDQQLADALAYSQASNIALLNVANEFVTETQQIGASRASTLRLVQTGGIVLALLNFAFILFKFLRRLQTSDAAIESANEENREILTSVREGLFLLTPDFRLGSQLSASAHGLFGRQLAAGDNFFTVLQPLVTEKALSDARDYVELLFSAHVKEALVQDINPLSEVELLTHNRLGRESRRYLSFHFNRVQVGGAVRHLLVTVQDITARIELERKLGEERQRSQKEFGMLLKAIDADPALLRQFVGHAETGLLEVNDLLRGTSGTQGEAAILKRLDQAARRVHAIKGDAATLGLDSIAAQAHQFETELARVRQTGGGDIGAALVALPLPLEELLTKIGALKALTGVQRAAAEPAAADAGNAALVRLAQEVAAAGGKKVEPTVRMGAVADLEPEAAGLVREIAVQLLRNALAHGVEPPAERRAAGKPEEGKVEVQLVRGEADWCLSVRDDGGGLSAPRVRQRLLDLRWYTPAQLENFDDRQIVSHIFRPGFSTASDVSLHAGRGVGLDLVQANVQKLGARLTLSSTPGRHTEFKIRFA
ncbi:MULTISPECIES: ATP-binding protein [Ramlibacter]|uniref:histidine kinase n=1 Tax=Ramlibacter pinisoli TaxID=2682844 RepID=A0A6N8IP17_9BURK|nr:MULTISPECIES: ATP-binding protein [Ramlibacter]MBA2963622.1 Hpt domain-containing protein [Ramlibacter sp. CGMCC 1.13660]MVQ28587.1 chemotaxis protein CheA [Ramlibacter pinisoli]